MFQKILYGQHPAYTPPNYPDDYAGLMAEEARASASLDREEKPVLWRNVFGEPVDLDDIDREYALNILSMVIARRARAGYTADEMREDPLIQKLREVVLEGREKTAKDRRRARRYNKRTAKLGLPYRASEG